MSRGFFYAQFYRRRSSRGVGFPSSGGRAIDQGAARVVTASTWRGGRNGLDTHWTVRAGISLYFLVTILWHESRVGGLGFGISRHAIIVRGGLKYRRGTKRTGGKGPYPNDPTSIRRRLNAGGTPAKLTASSGCGQARGRAYQPQISTWHVRAKPSNGRASARFGIGQNMRTSLAGRRTRMDSKNTFVRAARDGSSRPAGFDAIPDSRDAGKADFRRLNCRRLSREACQPSRRSASERGVEQ